MLRGEEEGERRVEEVEAPEEPREAVAVLGGGQLALGEEEELPVDGKDRQVLGVLG